MNCAYNKITSLDLSHKTKLYLLFVSNNLLTSLTVTEAYGLKNIDISSNPLQTLILTDAYKLSELYCYHLNLNTLNLANDTSLHYLDCSNNKLTNVDFSSLTSLDILNCSNNQLTNLDLSNLTQLSDLTCYINKLETISIKNMQNEKINFVDNPNLKYICADESQIPSLKSQLLTENMLHVQVDSHCKLVENMAESGEFYLYPNPANTTLTIENPALTEIEIEVINAMGQTLLAQKVIYVEKIDLTSFHSGVYWVKNITNKQVHSFIKL